MITSYCTVDSTHRSDLSVTVILCASSYVGHHPTTKLHSTLRSEDPTADYVHIGSRGNLEHIISNSCLLIMMMTQSSNDDLCYT